MIYGIPSIPVPHVLDQMGFATQLCEAGVSTQPIKSKDLSEERVIAAIEEMLANYQEKMENAKAISEKIRSEGGVAEAVRLIKEVTESKS